MDGTTKVAEYIMKLVNWERTQDKDGNMVFYNSHTQELTKIPDPVFLLLEEKLVLVRNAIKKSQESSQLQDLLHVQIESLQDEKVFYMDQTKKLSIHIHELEKNEIKRKEKQHNMIKIIEKIFIENVSSSALKKENVMETEEMENNTHEIEWKLQEIEKKLIDFRDATKKHALDKETLTQKNEELTEQLMENAKIKESEKPGFVEEKNLTFKNEILQKRINFLEKELLKTQNLIQNFKGQISIDPVNSLRAERPDEKLEKQELVAINEKSSEEIMELNSVLELENSIESSSETILKLEAKIFLLGRSLNQSQALVKNLTRDNQELIEDSLTFENKLKRRHKLLSDVEAKLADKDKSYQYYKKKFNKSEEKNDDLAKRVAYSVESENRWRQNYIKLVKASKEFS